MGPKKKKSGDTGGKKAQSSSSSSGNRKSSTQAQVQLSAENQQRLRRLLLQNNVEKEKDASSTGSLEPLSDLQKKQAAKRLHNIYEKLASEGFSDSQIELGLSAFPVGEATLEAVLDWLCLNIPGNELPKKYSSGVVEADECTEGKSVQLIAAARTDWVPPSTSHASITSDVTERVIKSNRIPEKDTEDDRKVQADWIRQYMVQLNEDDDGFDGSSKESDVESDWEGLVDEDDVIQTKSAHAATNSVRTAQMVANEFRAAREAAADAKIKGNREKQVHFGKLISKLKQELATLGLSEDILREESVPFGSSKLNAVDGESTPQRKEIKIERSKCGELDSGLDMSMLNEEQTAPDNCKKSPEQGGDENLEAVDDMFGLFDEDSANQGSLPDTILEIQKKEKANAWSTGKDFSGKKKAPQKDKNLPNQVTAQRQPKAVLQQQCQKNGWDLPKYQRVSGNNNLYEYNVTIVRPTSGRGKNKIIGGSKTYHLPDNASGFHSVEEAQNKVATWALYSLFPDLPLYHIIPEPYRGMLLKWHMQEEQVCDGSENSRRASFVDSLVNTVKEQKEESAHLPVLAFSTEFSKETDIPELSERNDELNRRIPSQDAESKDLLDKYKAKMRRKNYKAMLQSREALPIYAVKNQLIKEIRENDVVVVSGETGSGKTTQVPQYILEDLICANQGALCNIICTQPRRLAAISIAERVAEEQGDGAPGTSESLVGYHVRLDSAWNRGTKLLFCTTGILLRRLAGDRNLNGVSHVIVDEVHERSVLGDFALVILKDLIERRRGTRQLPLKIILMSATVDASLYSRYFGDCPVVKVEGRTFPVKSTYLEDVYEMLGYQLGSDSPAAISSNPFYQTTKRIPGHVLNTSRGRQNRVQYDWDVEEEELFNPLYDESLYRDYSQRTNNNLMKLNEEVIDYDLLEDLVVHIDQTAESGAILVFLPGIGEILALCDKLSASSHFRGKSSDWIIPLHSSISAVEQRKAFQQPPTDIRKIVLATNIAETSITIEDVVHVIDCGKHKEMQYDPHRGMSRMVETWISQANAKQRRGRAGRVKPGYCYCMYTKYRFEKLLRSFQLPEMLRVPLVEICLQIKFLELGDITLFLDKAIEPPRKEAITSAVSTLHEVGALDDQGELTALGFHLAKLPVEVHLGKMLLYGAVLGCLSHALTIAACLSYKSPFSASRDQMAEAERARQAFLKGKMSSHISQGQQSDHLAMAAAFSNWLVITKKRGSRAAFEFCKTNFLSVPTLNMLRDMRIQFAILLADIGFITVAQGNRIKRDDVDNWIDDPSLPFNRNVNAPSILKATICAGLYPKVAKMDEESIRSGHAIAGGKRAGLASSNRVHWMDARQEVYIHPSSVNHKTSEFRHPFLIYHEKVKTSKVYIRDTTVISPYTLLLFGGAISVQHQTGQVAVDGWLKMNAPAQTAVLFKELRVQLDSVLQELIRNPKVSLAGLGEDVVSYIVKLLEDEEDN